MHGARMPKALISSTDLPDRAAGAEPALYWYPLLLIVPDRDDGFTPVSTEWNG
ncbi:16629_t:CDS:2 [Acaulospora colombiana]|uniref:16629_t:CDS:1 n=1 Tax=Acaulospora colombiana TaxID=27376 RepID=A0ACA9Q7S9_9GLOM|nr:16629_t:CDS:2 [Acaulospora colombiana]